MKKILLFALTTLLLFSFIGCKDELLGVSVDDWNADSQYNYDFVGRSMTYSEPSDVILARTDTTSGSDTTSTFEAITLATTTYTITFSELTDGVGTFTMVETDVATAAADTAYADTATVTYTEDDGVTGANFDNTGYSGVVFYTYTATGTYEVNITDDNNRNYILSMTSITNVDNNAAGAVPRGGTYTAAGNGTVSYPTTGQEAFVAPNNGYQVFDQADGSMVVMFDPFFNDFGFTYPGSMYNLVP